MHHVINIDTECIWYIWINKGINCVREYKTTEPCVVLWHYYRPIWPKSFQLFWSLIYMLSGAQIMINKVRWCQVHTWRHKQGLWAEFMFLGHGRWNNDCDENSSWHGDRVFVRWFVQTFYVAFIFCTLVNLIIFFNTHKHLMFSHIRSRLNFGQPYGTILLMLQDIQISIMV